MGTETWLIMLIYILPIFFPRSGVQAFFFLNGMGSEDMPIDQSCVLYIEMKKISYRKREKAA